MVDGQASRDRCVRIGSVNDSYSQILYFFFFQAEDGIRDLIVTGVQTCALPILAVGKGQEVALHDGAGDPARLVVARRGRDRIPGLPWGRRVAVGPSGIRRGRGDRKSVV